MNMPPPVTAPPVTVSPPAIAPPPARPGAAPVRLSKVTLTKEAPSVSLTKQGGTSGAMRVNLNWQVRKQFSGWGSKRGRAVAHRDLDLDLAPCTSCPTAARESSGRRSATPSALHQPPYIHLDGDDRTGAVASGENLTVNLDHKQSFRRILIFVTIYEGARSFADLHADDVTLQPLNGAPVDFSLDECTVPSTVCALALITNNGGDLIVQREARYLAPERGVSPQRTVDRVYGWGMKPGPPAGSDPRKWPTEVTQEVTRRK